MRTTIAKLFSYAGLLLTLVPSMLVFAGSITFQAHKQLMLMGTVLWFVTAPFWLGKQK
ncbi:MAG: hypothetical protein ONB11_09665 [candidate division KSB1 bacterium]|nr:hypothetical protein [candidate division KSB1 bacterium]